MCGGLFFNIGSVLICTECKLCTATSRSKPPLACPHKGCHLLPAILTPLPHSHCKREPGKINRRCSLPPRSLHWPWKGRGYQNPDSRSLRGKRPAASTRLNPQFNPVLLVLPLSRLPWHHRGWGHLCFWHLKLDTDPEVKPSNSDISRKLLGGWHSLGSKDLKTNVICGSLLGTGGLGYLATPQKRSSADISGVQCGHDWLSFEVLADTRCECGCLTFQFCACVLTKRAFLVSTLLPSPFFAALTLFCCSPFRAWIPWVWRGAGKQARPCLPHIDCLWQLTEVSSETEMPFILLLGRREEELRYSGLSTS